MACSTLATGSGMMAAVAPLAAQLGGLGWNVRVVGPIRPGEGAVAVDGNGAAPVHLLRRPLLVPRSLAEAWGTAAATAEFSRQRGTAVVHVHGVWTAANAAACFRAKTLGVPYVVSPHGMLLPVAMRHGEYKKRLAIGAFVRHNLEAAAFVHASSEAERASVLAVAPRARTSVIPWGVDIREMVACGRPNQSRRQAAYIGRLIPLKGVDHLLAAWSAVRPGGWDLRFIGPDPEGYARQVSQAIDSAQLRDSVTIQPPLSRKDLLQAIQQLDLLILPSHSENFGMVVAEALAAGVPVITTTATPWRDVVERKCGWWVADTIHGLATAIRDACGLGVADLAAMGSRGRAWMCESFAWPRIAQRFAEELYAACR